MIRNILGGFLFSGDDIYKRAGVLSGGERTRLAVARMLLRPANTLLLDEPTNHLDLDSKDVLLDALEDFGGTLIFVSHDRYFVDRLATKIIEVGHGDDRGLSGHLRAVPLEPRTSEPPVPPARRSRARDSAEPPAPPGQPEAEADAGRRRQASAVERRASRAYEEKKKRATPRPAAPQRAGRARASALPTSKAASPNAKRRLRSSRPRWPARVLRRPRAAAEPVIAAIRP